MVANLSQFSIKLGGQRLHVLGDPASKSRESYSGRLAPQESDRTIVKRDVVWPFRRYDRGCGFVEERDEKDWDGYAWAEDMFMWLENGPGPSGRRVNVGFGLGVGYAAADVRIHDAVLFNGAVWALTNHGKILRYANADPSSVPVEHPPSGLAFNGGSTGFRAGFVGVSMAVFTNAAGLPALYVTTAGGAGTRIYEYEPTAGTPWTESAITGFGAGPSVSSWWEDREGVGAERLHIVSGASEIRHCIQGNNPLTAANYNAPITVGNGAYPITALVAAPQHLYVVKTNGIHDFNEMHSWPITPYWQETAQGGSTATLYDDHIYGTLGGQIDRYDVRLNGAAQRIPGICGPMAFMQDGTPVAGTAQIWGSHDGWLLGSILNLFNQKTYVMRGKSRDILRVDIKNPLVWHGAEQVISPVGGRTPNITKMLIAPASSGQVYMWMFVTIGSAPGYDVDLYYAPLPTGSGPLSTRASGGTFTYNPTGRIFHTAITGGDRFASKGIRRYDFVCRSIGSGRTVEVKARADGDPATIADTSTYTSQGTASSSNTQSVAPTTVTAGNGIGLLTILTTPSPYTVAPQLLELSTRGAMRREVFDVRYLDVILERNHPLRDRAPDPRKPDTIWEAVKTLANQATPTTLEDEEAAPGVTKTVYVEQEITYRKERISARQWRTIAKLEISVVSAV